jgi:hypothetical protein
VEKSVRNIPPSPLCFCSSFSSSISIWLEVSKKEEEKKSCCETNTTKTIETTGFLFLSLLGVNQLVIDNVRTSRSCLMLVRGPKGTVGPFPSGQQQHTRRGVIEVERMANGG